MSLLFFIRVPALHGFRKWTDSEANVYHIPTEAISAGYTSDKVNSDSL